MRSEKRAKLIRYGVVFGAAVVIGVIYYLTRAGDASGEVNLAPKQAAISVRGSGSERVGVHVVGAVRRPGLYLLRSGARINDAIEKAGGVRPEGDVSGLNLAAKVEDGRQVVVPGKADGGGQSTLNQSASKSGSPGGQTSGSGVGSPTGTSGAGASGSAVGVGVPNVPGQLLNLNMATVEQLDQLDGVGPATARKIVEYRQQRGGFSSVDDLGQIPGIGEKKLLRFRQQVTV